MPHFVHPKLRRYRKIVLGILLPQTRQLTYAVTHVVPEALGDTGDL